MTEFRLGRSIDDETTDFRNLAVDVDVELFASLSLKAQYHIDKFYVNAFDTEFSDDEFDVGFIVGAGVNLTPGLALEFNAEFYDSDTSLSDGFKYKF